jgi:hypothetical protein
MPSIDREEIDRPSTFSNDRNVTTRVAKWLRGVTLDAGSELAGMEVSSDEPTIDAITAASEIRRWGLPPDCLTPWVNEIRRGPLPAFNLKCELLRRSPP